LQLNISRSGTSSGSSSSGSSSGSSSSGSTSTAPTCTYGVNTNNWWIEFNCDQEPTSGVSVTCSSGLSYSCTLASWGTYQCQITGSTECDTPRQAYVNSQCVSLDAGSCGSASSLVDDESTSGSQNTNISPILAGLIGIVVAIIILVVLLVIVVRNLRTPVVEHV